MLTRIYGTAFETKAELKKYLEDLENAEKYNHRTLGKQLKLFAIIPEIVQGLPVWLPRGYTMRRILENYMFDLERAHGYQHILTPHIVREELFKISGHLNFYKDSMYAPIKVDEENYYLKPMNCPEGMMVYKMETRSYRDLPFKLG
jgi:threonyl-tRNA synthetase